MPERVVNLFINNRYVRDLRSTLILPESAPSRVHAELTSALLDVQGDITGLVVGTVEDVVRGLTTMSTLPDVSLKDVLKAMTWRLSRAAISEYRIGQETVRNSKPHDSSCNKLRPMSGGLRSMIGDDCDCSLQEDRFRDWMLEESDFASWISLCIQHEAWPLAVLS